MFPSCSLGWGPHSESAEGRYPTAPFTDILKALGLGTEPGRASTGLRAQLGRPAPVLKAGDLKTRARVALPSPTSLYPVPQATQLAS